MIKIAQFRFVCSKFLEATPNPINFCNNEPSQEKLTEDDDDGVDWEKDTYLLKTFSRNGNT